MKGAQKTTRRAQSSLAGFTLIELLVVVGIFGLTVGVFFTLLATSRNAADLNEVQLQTKEYAQRALERIAGDLRLSRPDRVRIANNLSWYPAAEVRPGSALNLQIPVGSSAVLDLTPAAELKWGSETTENQYIGYSIDGSFNLIRSLYTSLDASDAVSVTISRHITSLTFNRQNPSSDLVTVTVTAQRQGPFGLINQTLTSDVYLRN